MSYSVAAVHGARTAATALGDPASYEGATLAPYIARRSRGGNAPPHAAAELLSKHLCADVSPVELLRVSPTRRISSGWDCRTICLTRSNPRPTRLPTSRNEWPLRYSSTICRSLASFMLPSTA